MIEDLLANVVISDELVVAKQGYCQQHQLTSDDALDQHINDKNLTREQFEDICCGPTK